MESSKLTRAEANLRKFVALEDEKPTRKYLEKHAINNGTQVASNSFIAAVILPEGKTEWDLADAYIEGQKETGKPDIGRSDVGEVILRLKDGMFAEELSFSKSFIKSIIDAANKTQDDYKREHGRNRDKFYTDIGIDFGATDIEGMITLDRRGDKVAYFSVKYLLDVMKFIKCAKAEWAKVYFSGRHMPVVLQADNLYAVISPLRR